MSHVVVLATSSHVPFYPLSQRHRNEIGDVFFLFFGLLEYTRLGVIKNSKTGLYGRILLIAC